MMSVLCSPNGGFPLIGLGVGCLAAIIWMGAHGRLRRIPDDPLARYNYQTVGGLIVLLGGGTGYIVGLIVSQFISFRNFC
jgi:hypothetical protein